jgi:hypothetical protein
VDASFYSRNLGRSPVYIDRVFGLGVTRALGGNAATAELYFNRAVSAIDRYKARLEQPGMKEEFERCYATGAKLNTIIDTTTPAASDKPLNAWGDIITQLEHLSYAIRSFMDELTAPPGPPPPP